MRWDHCLDKAPASVVDVASTMSSARSVIKSFAPDLIVTALPAANSLIPIVNRLSGGSARVVISHHSPVGSYSTKANVLDTLIGGSSSVDGIVCVSEAVRASLATKSLRYQAKVRVIRNALPIDIDQDIAALGHRSTLSSEKRIVACGRLAHQKNYPALIRALKLVEGASLIIIGSGPEEDPLKSLAQREGVAARIEFTGFLPRKETLAAVAQAHIFVQPSAFEGHSLALVEAAKLGRPLIVSDVPSQIEAITRRDGVRCAKVHPLHDHAALADHIATILGSEMIWNHYAALAQTLGAEQDFEAMVSAYYELFCEHGL